MGVIDNTPGTQVWLWGPWQLSWRLNYYHLPSSPAPEIPKSLSCYCDLRSVILPYVPLRGGHCDINTKVALLPWLKLHPCYHDCMIREVSTLYTLLSWRRCRSCSAMWMILLASFSEFGYLCFHCALNLLISFKIFFSFGVGLALPESNIFFIFSLFPALSFPLLHLLWSKSFFFFLFCLPHSIWSSWARDHIWATVASYATAVATTRSLTHWAELGAQHSRDATNPTVPQQELQNIFFKIAVLLRYNSPLKV